MGIESVIYFSDADKHSLPVRLANFGICLEPPKSEYTYLNMNTIIAAAKFANVDAIHPGYGFLSENADFAELCQKSGFVFIGPSPKNIQRMGDKAEAKKIMMLNGISVIPGSDGDVYSSDSAFRIAKDIGYPVIVKAVAGGGGRGMRIAHNSSELAEAIHISQSESRSAFGNGSVYIEKYFHNARHVEFQILADAYGNAIHLGERDCSVQRRYQKLIEESPSPSISESLRSRMSKTAMRVVRAVDYRNVGTVEFLIDENDNYYFMEMNTRIQVEHPVSEMVTGIDVVGEQIKIAEGRMLQLKQDDIVFSGHAIECRINAEDPSHNFMPSPGLIKYVEFPEGTGVRVDTHIYSGYVIPSLYDSLLAKLIVHGRDRHEAIGKMQDALGQFMIKGIESTIPFHKDILLSPEFVQGRAYTKFVEYFMENRKKRPKAREVQISESCLQNFDKWAVNL